MSDPPESVAPRPLSFFIPGLNGGGAQRVFVTLVNTLVNMTNHPIHLVTLRKGGAFEGLVDERVVRVVLGPRRALLSVLPLARYIRTQRPAAMVSTLDYCNVIFLVATLFARVPLRKVVREANVIPDNASSQRQRIESYALRFLMRLMYRWADDVIVITKDVERSLIGHRIATVERMRQIPNPVTVDEARPDSSKSTAPPREAFILAIGRLSYQKGFDILIRAFAELADQDIKLVILGDGPLENDLKKLVRSLHLTGRVLFQGFVPNTSAYLKTASLFVLPSRWEGFSNVLAEALAAGTPIVSSDCPGSPREVLANGRLGRLVPVDDPRALGEAIAAELDSASATSEAKRQHVAQYAPERIGAEYLLLLTGPRDP